MNLTARQQQILEFIEDCMQTEGLPPTRAEIVAHFGFASPNAAQCHLRALADRGAIELRPGRARGIVPLHPAVPTADESAARRLPVVGRVAAGSPILAIENQEREVLVDTDLFHPSPEYLLRVEGDSMTGAGIRDGDLLMVHSTPEARTGQIVVARINEEVTVKRLRFAGEQIVLEAENPSYAPITVDRRDDFSIEGTGVGILRPRIDQN